MHIRVSIAEQILTLLDENSQVVRRYSVSTATKGVGEERGSFQTPRGLHIVRAKIGAGVPENSVFVGRRPTGEIFTRALGDAFPERDWILSRILWLSGRELGRNRGGLVDTMRRYIYIHGCPDVVPIGVPGSHGCIRMRNTDIIELFDFVQPYALVEISEI